MTKKSKSNIQKNLNKNSEDSCDCGCCDCGCIEQKSQE